MSVSIMANGPGSYGWRCTRRPIFTCSPDPSLSAVWIAIIAEVSLDKNLLTKILRHRASLESHLASSSIPAVCLRRRITGLLSPFSACRPFRLLQVFLVCLVGSQDQTSLSGDQPINLKPCRLRFQLALGSMITRVLQIVLESSRILYTRGSNETDPARRTKFHHPIPIGAS